MNSERAVFICIAHTSWGKSIFPTRAIEVARKELGVRKLKNYLLYECADPDAYVDGMGGIVAKQGTKFTLIEVVKDGHYYEINDGSTGNPLTSI